MKVGVVIDETWAFFHEIFSEFSSRHDVTKFEKRHLPTPFLKERINRELFRRDFQKFLNNQNVTFFEWASHRLEAASKLEKTCGVVTRLHRYEMYQWAPEINWDFVDRLILVSEAKQREFGRKFPEQAHKVVVIPEAICLDQFTRNERTFDGNLGTLCHLSPRKRVYELILSFHELSKRHAGFHLHIGGGERPLYPDYFDAITGLIRRLGIEENVTLYGHVNDPAAWYANIDIFISNSYSEGLQVSPMEAIASGCLCLSHWWDGADELLPESELYLTDEDLIQRVLEYRDSSQVVRSHRREAQYNRVHDRFNMRDVKLQIRELTEQVGQTWAEHS